MIQEVFADIFLGLAAVIVLASALGVLVMPDVYRKLHFVTPASLVAPALVALAVFIQQGVDENTGQTLIALLFVGIAGPYLSHATIRAARVRDQGDWRGRAASPGPEGPPAPGPPAPSAPAREEAP